MKKLINDPAEVVADALTGMAAVHPDMLTIHRNPDFIRRRNSPVAGKVALVSGGGSGHEPMHGGFVGIGMLDAACPGAVFTSPSANQIQAAAAAVATEAGVLFIVKNYTGDRLNFTMAAEWLADDGIPCEVVLVDDDVAVENSTHTAGRRGTGATVLVEKIAGAAAEQGRSLLAVAQLARRVNAGARSMGLALTSSTVPHVGSPNFVIGDAEVELGVGIHGEPGRRRIPHAPVKELVALLSEAVIGDLPFVAGDRVIAFTNGLGGTPLIELYIAAGELAACCAAHGLTVARSLAGSYITALEMAGCTITLLRVDDEMLELWDAPVTTAALRW